VLSANFSYPLSLGGLINVPSLQLDAAPDAYYASFTATLANLITNDESESLGPMYGLIRQELLSVATSTLPWAVQLCSSYYTISTMGGFSESDLVVLRNTLNQDLSDYVGPDVELVVSLLALASRCIVLMYKVAICHSST
jgi:hypothetical protein